jgi:hypothetical protein
MPFRLEMTGFIIRGGRASVTGKFGDTHFYDSPARTGSRKLNHTVADPGIWLVANALRAVATAMDSHGAAFQRSRIRGTA